ncbi:MAG TPA: TonB-dependent receptor [Rhizomicrobium sp.]|jgi:outer membrane receptor protein involved in Fe transport|nr:TonB-dependent receptor [Rhizomicrobium sp.]
MRIKSRLVLSTALAGLFVSGGTALAAPAAESGQIETVIVTAEKKQEKLQDVPGSVTALDTTQLSGQGLTDLKDYAAQVPGLSLSSGNPGFQQITLRGISTGQAEPGATTAIYIDEAPVGSVNAYTGGSGNTADLDPADVAHIEVLKGPQGTLYGANAMGGLLKYVMLPPDTTGLSGHVTASGDTVDGSQGYRLTGTVNVPLGDSVALKVNGYDRFEPGFIDNVNGKTNDNPSHFAGGRAALLWNVNDDVNVTFSAVAQDIHDDGSPAQDVDAVTLKPLFGDLKNFRNFPESQQESLRLYNATMDGTWGGLNVVSSTTYQTIKTKVQADATNSYGFLLGLTFGIPDFGVISRQDESTERFAQDVRVSDNAFGGALEYQLGAYFTHENDINQIPGFDARFTNTGATIPLPEDLVHAFIKSQYTEYSIYGNATYHFTDQFDVLAGVRLAYDDQHYSQDYEGLIVGATPVVFAKKAEDRIATWQVTPRFKIDDDQMVYAKVSTGYRPGGPNAVPPATVLPGVPQDFAPDRITSYEAGYKSAWLDNALTFDGAVFYNDWQNVQIQTSGGGFNFIVNGGSARTQGVELSLAYVPVEGLTLGLNGSYIDANLTSNAPAAGGVKGDRLPFVPHWSGALTADYRHLLFGDFTFDIGGALNYVGDRASDYSLRSPVTVPGYTVVDLHAGVSYQNYEVSLFAKNLNDARGITALGSQTLFLGAGNPYSAAVIQPRTIGIQLTAAFQ